jgi:ketosteroid isomerase-like protein
MTPDLDSSQGLTIELGLLTINPFKTTVRRIALASAQCLEENEVFTFPKKRIVMKSLLLALIVPSLSIPAHAQEQTPLYKEIAAMDKVLFDAFNRQDAEGVKAVFSTDLEFFHDMGGLQNYEQNHEATRKLFARNLQLKRELVPGSMEVYQVKNYGAIQTGQHTFCHIENGTDDCGTFKFLQIWKRTVDGWKLSRVVSYGH